MGAADFKVNLVGKSLPDEFARAVEAARYEYGHGGYTGTIAEKDGYVFVGQMPPRLTVDRLEQYLWEYEKWEVRVEDHRTGWSKRKPGQNPVPETYRAFVAKVYPIYRDKWGPAAVIELTGTQAAKIKERRGRKGTHDKVWVAIGLASH